MDRSGRKGRSFGERELFSQLTDPADEAVVLLESRTDIALFFTDINMPGSMDGLKLARAVRDRWPPIKVFVVSGQVLPRQSDLPSSACFISKPYEMAAMVTELRSLVGPPGT